MDKYTIRKIAGTENFDLSTLTEKASFTQAKFYGDWQAGLGRKVLRFEISDSDSNNVVAYFQAIKYSLMGDKSYLYIPYGPVVDDGMRRVGLRISELLNFVKSEISKIATRENAVFARLDFTPSIANELLSKYFTKAREYTYHSAYFQPRVEWYLDIAKPEDQLLAEMHKNTRYSIHTADKRDVYSQIITDGFEKYFSTFYDLMLETSKRNGFSLHPKKYYQEIFKNLQEIGAYLSVAKFGEKILAIDLIITYAGTANYVFSGSSSEERNRMPAYSALWCAILHAKKYGCQFFNFGGVSTGDNDYRGWDGLSSFKRKFGGIEMKHSDFFDVVAQPFWYHMYNLRKRLKKL